MGYKVKRTIKIIILDFPQSSQQLLLVLSSKYIQNSFISHDSQHHLSGQNHCHLLPKNQENLINRSPYGNPWPPLPHTKTLLKVTMAVVIWKCNSYHITPLPTSSFSSHIEFNQVLHNHGPRLLLWLHLLVLTVLATLAFLQFLVCAKQAPT